MKHTASLLLAAAMIMSTPATAQSIDPKVQARIDRILKATPLIDGHNDLPGALGDYYDSKVDGLASGTDQRQPNPLMTDMARLHQGRVGAQFWSVYIDFNLRGDEAIRRTIEQIDIVKRLVKAYPNDLALALTADDVVRIHKTGRVASLIGIEGGHQIGGSLATLRQFYDLGARYMTLAHFTNNEFADSSNDDPKYHGLNDFGKTVVHEMNRLGMLVDLSHVSEETMRAALATSRAPVIFSHSGARALDDHPRNVSDDVLKLVARNGGVVMVNFFAGYVSDDFRKWNAEEGAEEARLKSLFVGQPQARDAALAAWKKANPAPTVTVSQVADHVDHIAKVAGYDHVGIGGDLDGIPYDQGPQGMNTVSGYPLLFAELIRRGWSDENLAKLAGGNVLRVMRAAEQVSASLKDEQPALGNAPVEPPK
jgi:membrane dipeptidase